MSTGNEIVATENVTRHQEQSVIVTPSATAPHAVSPPDVDAPVQAPRGRRILGILCAAVLIAAIVWGLRVRAATESAVADATQTAAILSVNVVHPVEGSKADDLALPGNVEAFTDTPIYSRTTATLKNGTSISASMSARAISSPRSRRPKSTSNWISRAPSWNVCKRTQSLPA